MSGRNVVVRSHGLTDKYIIYYWNRLSPGPNQEEDDQADYQQDTERDQQPDPPVHFRIWTEFLREPS